MRAQDGDEAEYRECTDPRCPDARTGTGAAAHAHFVKVTRASEDDRPDPKPDWVMAGIPWGTQVAVYASRNLTEGDIVGRTRFGSIMHGSDRIYTQKTTYRLAVRMDDFVMVIADTYRQALNVLAETWNPDDAVQRKEIEQR